MIGINYIYKLFFGDANFVRPESVLVLNVKYVHHVFQKELNLLPTRDLSSFKISIQNFNLEKKCLSRGDSIFKNSDSIEMYDADLWNAFNNEASRQEEHLELIASENYASKRILEAQGSVLTNKYAEGYPSKRYYGGCEYVDIAEELAISRAKELFKADYANVQPHSGSSANAAAFLACFNLMIKY